jgi:glycosyltransferase involved in cell wall biosynthesis
MTSPMVGVGVPVWQGATFVAETLESILAQRDVRFQLFISVDGADAETELCCRPFLSDPRVRLAVQPHRLGWVANTAAALAGATDDGVGLVCVQPHDDLLDPNYLAALVESAEANPQAAVVYSDLKTFGDWEQIIFQHTVAGSPVERQVVLLRSHFSSVAYRGLTRVSALSRVPPISGNAIGDFACDTVWMARLARVGDLIRVPEVLYRKRLHSGSAHRSWLAWTREQKIDAWMWHCLDMLAEALAAATGAEERRLVIDAAHSRLLMEAGSLGPYHADIEQMGADDKAKLREKFEAAATARRDMGRLDNL